MPMQIDQRALAAVFGLGLAIGGCSSSQSVPNKEAMLTSAGFEQRAADTPKRQAMMERLPPHSLVKRNLNGKAVYVYADPTGCRCVYVGNQAAFARYQQSSHTPQESVRADESANWDWEPWGMGGWRD